MGEIILDWDAPITSDLVDVLGYNMYRYEANSDGTFTDPVKINKSLITETKYNDYEVVRLKDYYISTKSFERILQRRIIPLRLPLSF